MAQYKPGRAAPWQVQIRDINGKVVTRSFTTKADAEKFEADEKRKKQLFRAGMEAPQEHILFIDGVKEYLKYRHAMVLNQDLALSSFKQDESRLRNYWIEPFGKRPLQTITSAEIIKHLDYIQYELGHSGADRNRHRVLMHSFFQWAFKRDRVPYNPVAKTDPVPEKSKKKRITIKDLELIETYLAALHAEGPHYGMLGEIMVGTGCRISEAIGLQWQDIDEENGLVIFRRIEERAGGSKIVERTKGTGMVIDEEDAHVVPLFPRFREALEKHRARSSFTKPSDHIACTAKGTYIPYDTFKDVHPRAVKASGIPEITPHSLRRSFATLAKKAGYTRAEIRELGGWSSEAIVGRYDRKDVQHLIEKGKRLGFGVSAAENVVAIKRGRK